MASRPVPGRLVAACAALSPVPAIAPAQATAPAAASGADAALHDGDALTARVRVTAVEGASGTETVHASLLDESWERAFHIGSGDRKYLIPKDSAGQLLAPESLVLNRRMPLAGSWSAPFPAPPAGQMATLHLPEVEPPGPFPCHAGRPVMSGWRMRLIPLVAGAALAGAAPGRAQTFDPGRMSLSLCRLSVTCRRPRSTWRPAPPPFRPGRGTACSAAATSRGASRAPTSSCPWPAMSCSASTAPCCRQRQNTARPMCPT